MVASNRVAIDYALRRDNENAIAIRNQSAHQRGRQTFYLKYDPVFGEIPSDPRSIALEKKNL